MTPMLIFLQLYSAHLIADFLLQPDWVVQDKAKPRALGFHAWTHLLCSCVLVNAGLTWDAGLAITAIALSHVLVDFWKSRMAANGWAAFVIDQTIHLLIVAVAAVWLSAASLASVSSVVGEVIQSEQVYLMIAAYVGVVFGGSFLVQKVTQSFLKNIESQLQALKPGLPKAGTYIGWVERFLVMTFVVMGLNDAVGFLLAVKALVRFPEIKEDAKGHFAEYFLIGTLTSVGVALVGALSVKAVLTRLGVQ